MDRRVYSLRRHLLALISIPILLTGSLAFGLALLFTYHEIDEVYDAQLVHAAKLLHDLTRDDLAATSGERPTAVESRSELAHYYEQKISYRIWKDGELVAESYSAGNLGGLFATPGFSRVNIEGTDWHVFVYVNEETGITVELAEHAEVRTELILQILSSLVLPTLFAIPLVFLLVWLGVTRSLRPMITLARQINQRNATDLTPLSTGRIPRELLPFTISLNRLFRRVEQSLRMEREFTDNAAHELRTPLAAMKTQAQVLGKAFDGTSPQREGIDNLLDSIDRANRMVEQLLAFARLQHDQEFLEEVELSELTREILRELIPLAIARNQDIQFEIGTEVKIHGSEPALIVMIRNIIDNAIKYSPHGSEIHVEVGQESGNPVFVVRDSGPGIPVENQKRVFDRFYRVSRGEDTGSGLGLAMVRWVAEMHNADIKIENLKPHGMSIKVIFNSDSHKDPEDIRETAASVPNA